MAFALPAEEPVVPQHHVADSHTVDELVVLVEPERAEHFSEMAGEQNPASNFAGLEQFRISRFATDARQR